MKSLRDKNQKMRKFSLFRPKKKHPRSAKQTPNAFKPSHSQETRLSTRQLVHTQALVTPAPRKSKKIRTHRPTAVGIIDTTKKIHQTAWEKCTNKKTNVHDTTIIQLYETKSLRTRKNEQTK